MSKENVSKEDVAKENVFETPIKTRLMLTALCFVIMFILAVIGVLNGGVVKNTYSLLGFCIVAFFTNKQSFIVGDNELVFKAMFRKKSYPYAGAKFYLQEKTGFAAFATNGKAKANILTYEKDGKITALPNMLPESDLVKILELIQSKSNF